MGWESDSNSGFELTTRSNLEAEIDEKLRKEWLDLIPILGPRAWQWDQLVLLKRQVLSRILHFNNIYQEILEKPGEIFEFGVQWGAGISTLLNLRSIYEPFNHSRKIVGFDTFSGFPSLEAKDEFRNSVGERELPKLGSYSVETNYQEKLEKFLSLHEQNAPISHKKKFELVKGDASLTFPKWLSENPSSICAMAIFDMDIYKPTKDVLEKLIPRLTRGSVLVFDELGSPNFPGETIALMEVLGLNKFELHSNPNQPYVSWFKFE